ncbi:MAG: hypothetical protein IJH91_03245 [Mogibacterium sp.]|nr:hypothetical protein [Mogibacterium sp.]
MPIIILIVVLMLRLFAFYLEILSVQVTAHVEASNLWNGYDKVAIRSYRDRKTVTLAAGGVLKSTVSKDIITETYLFNEDLIIRTGNLFSDK